MAVPWQYHGCTMAVPWLYCSCTVVLKINTSVLQQYCHGTATAFASDNIGNLTSLKAIADTLSSAGSKMNQQTADSYVSALLNSYMFYQVSRYDIHGRENLRVGNK